MASLEFMTTPKKSAAPCLSWNVLREKGKSDSANYREKPAHCQAPATYSGRKDLPNPAGADPLKIRTTPRSHGDPLLDVFAELLCARYMTIKVKIMSGKGATWNTWAGTEGHHP
jgi:hypothetical protein